MRSGHIPERFQSGACCKTSNHRSFEYLADSSKLVITALNLVSSENSNAYG